MAFVPQSLYKPQQKTCGGEKEADKSTHTLIKLSPLPTGDKSFAVWVPGHAGQTVFVRLRHFGPQLPRLATEWLAEKRGREGEKNKSGREKNGGKGDTGRSVKQGRGRGAEEEQEERRVEVSEYKQPPQYLWEPLAMFIFSKSSQPQIFLFVFCLHRRHAFVHTLTGETSDGAGAHLHVPEPQLGAVVRSAGDQVGVVGTPGQVGDTVGVTL